MRAIIRGIATLGVAIYTLVLLWSFIIRPNFPSLTSRARIAPNASTDVRAGLQQTVAEMRWENDKLCFTIAAEWISWHGILFKGPATFYFWDEKEQPLPKDNNTIFPIGVPKEFMMGDIVYLEIPVSIAIPDNARFLAVAWVAITKMVAIPPKPVFVKQEGE